jgi:hypothetical protein
MLKDYDGYVDYKLQDKRLGWAEHALEIIEEYAKDGYTLTVRQIYYQFVARNIVDNTKENYNAVQEMLRKARLGGYLPLDCIEDRTRAAESEAFSRSPQGAVRTALNELLDYQEDPWLLQPRRVEIWVEKEALVGVVARVASRWHLTYMADRGYVSLSARVATQKRLASLGFLVKPPKWNGKKSEWRIKFRDIRRMMDEMEEYERSLRPLILYLGDHDPSGIDMDRDIRESMEEIGMRIELERVALTQRQVQQYDLPPQWAKDTDTRTGRYVARHGHEHAWELDALPPPVLDGIIGETVRRHVDMEAWERWERDMKRKRKKLASLRAKWLEDEELARI